MIEEREIAGYSLKKNLLNSRFFCLFRRRLSFPGRLQPSIVGTDELNFRVRNGNGWTLPAIITELPNNTN